ncbi:MAG: hypothetical protein KDK34_02960, partial [Leptospiraceae bacterium]|nr:hypothetical protein [Leptospiraceae bacterium]
EAYFYTQKLAAQRVFEIIMGTGTKEERKNSRDDSVIGTFGMWAGKAPGDEEKGVSYETMQNVTTMMGENFLSGYSGGNLAMDNIVYGGFGEIGNYGMRPSGLQMGFYPQLQLAAMFQAEGERKAMNQASATTDPVSTLINQFNPIVLQANAYKNVELAHVDGKDRGYMWEAQFLDMGKNLLNAVAGVISSVPIIGPPIAAAVKFVSASIKVNPTTGERIFRSDDQAAIEAAAMLSGFVPGLGLVAAFATSGMQYNEKGQSQGWNAQQGVEQGTLSLIGELAGGGFVGDVISNAYNISKEYEKAKAGKDNNYLQYQNAGYGRLGALAGLYISHEVKKSKGFKDMQKGWMKTQKKMTKYANGPVTEETDRGPLYNIFAGMVAHFHENRKTYSKIGGYLNPFSKQGLGQYLHALGAESVGNYLTENIFRNDKKISIYEERILAAGTTEEAQRAMEQEIAKGNLSRERAEQAYYEGENLRAM